MMAFFTTGGYEWIIVLIVALLLFGRRLPEVMRSMGKGIKEFKKGLHDVEDEVSKVGEAVSPEDLRQLPERAEDGDEGSSSTPAG